MKIKHFVQYGGALFDSTCPECVSDLQMPEELSVNKFINTIGHNMVPTVTGTCEKCGLELSKFAGFLVDR